MTDVRHELDKLSRECWGKLGQDVKCTSNSMGRVGLSYARRHPALLLGGGALLGLGVVLWMNRGKGHHAHPKSIRESREGHDGDSTVEQREEAEAETKNRRAKKSGFTRNAVMTLAMKAAQMWIMQQLAKQEQVKQNEDDVEGEEQSDAGNDALRELLARATS